MRSSIIVITTAEGGALEYLYPSGDGHLMVVYGDQRKLEEMTGHVRAGLGDLAETLGMRVDTWDSEGSAEEYKWALQEVFVPRWAREHGPEWASKVALITDGDRAFDRVLRDVRENGIPGMLIQIAGDPL
jgi:hypothetical protein